MNLNVGGLQTIMPNFSLGIDPDVEIVINFNLQQLSGKFIEKD